MPARPRSTAVLPVAIVARPADRPATRGLGAWLGATAPRQARGAVTIAVVTDARMRALNRQFRQVDASTDVLSFPASAKASAGASGPGPGSDLGDIAIARGVATRQAKAAGHALVTEFRVLALHGLLHLLGYDHETDDGDMARVEARLLRRGGLAGGLIERTRMAPRLRLARRRRR